MLEYVVALRPSMLRSRTVSGRPRRKAWATSRPTRYFRSTRVSRAASSTTSASPIVANRETSKGATVSARIGLLALDRVRPLHGGVGVRPLPPGVLDGVAHRHPGGLPDEVDLVDRDAQGLQAEPVPQFDRHSLQVAEHLVQGE